MCVLHKKKIVSNFYFFIFFGKFSIFLLCVEFCSDCYPVMCSFWHTSSHPHILVCFYSIAWTHARTHREKQSFIHRKIKCIRLYFTIEIHLYILYITPEIKIYMYQNRTHTNSQRNILSFIVLVVVIAILISMNKTIV